MRHKMQPNRGIQAPFPGMPQTLGEAHVVWAALPGASFRARLCLSMFCVMALSGSVVLSGCQQDGSVSLPGEPVGKLIELEQDYRRETLAAATPATYRFHAPHRGAYLIIISDTQKSTELTLTNSRKTCFLQGNGSCELIASPGDDFSFDVLAPEGDYLSYTLAVRFTDGTGQYEGSVGNPIDLEIGRERQGRVGIRETSYYRFTPVVGGSFSIRVEKARGNLAWQLFNRKSYDVILDDCDELETATDEICRTGPLHGGMEYYLAVMEQSGMPQSYVVTVPLLTAPF